MNIDIETISTKAKPIFQKYGFKKVGIFGSRARGDYRPESDIDLLFSRGDTDNFVDLLQAKDELKNSFGVNVDLVDDRRVISRMRPQIKKDLKIIYEK